MNTFELLAPAGDLLKLKVALVYGADAVFIGGQQFSLRSRASNFTIADIKEGCDFAHALKKKVYVTCNIVMHQNDLKNLEEYLLQLQEAGVDAIITSSLHMAQLALSKTKLKVHISTQDSILNLEAIKFYKELGVERVVLGRECSLEDIDTICHADLTQIEVFIHGGMCSSYSGKCMLSNIMTNRDANRGGCAHSCRWKYDLYQNENKINPDGSYFAMSSKDLCSLDLIPSLIDAGVDSFKIEGRMKSLNYIACVCKAYKACITDYLNHKDLDFARYHQILSSAENRDTGIGFLKGNISINEQLFELDNECKRAGEFVGIVESYNSVTKEARILLRNKIEINHSYIVFGANHEDIVVKVDEFTVEGKSTSFEAYSVADDYILVKSDKTLEKYDIIRVMY